MNEEYNKIKFHKKGRIKKFRLDSLSFLDALVSAEEWHESLKISDLVGKTETNNHYNLDECVVALSAEDSSFLFLSSKSVIAAPYDSSKLYQSGILCFPTFDSFLGKLGYILGADVVSDRQGDYFFEASGREKLTIKHLREIVKQDYVAEVALILSVKKQ